MGGGNRGCPMSPLEVRGTLDLKYELYELSTNYFEFRPIEFKKKNRLNFELTTFFLN